MLGLDPEQTFGRGPSERGWRPLREGPRQRKSAILRRISGGMLGDVLSRPNVLDGRMWVRDHPGDPAAADLSGLRLRTVAG